MIEMLQFQFVRRALLSGICIGVTCALLGVFLLPRRFALMGEGLGHFAIGVVGVALFLGWAPLPVLLPALVVAAFVIRRLPSRAALYGDAAIGMVAVMGMALGVILASTGRGFNVDLISYLFGDILAVSRSESVMSVVLCVLVVGVTAVFYYDMVAVTVDEEQSRVLGVNVKIVDAILAVLIGLTVGVGIRSVGALLISGLLVFPAASSLQVARSVRGSLLVAAAFAVAGVLAGIWAAFRLNWPAGPSIILACGVLFVCCLLAGRIRRRGPESRCDQESAA